MKFDFTGKTVLVTGGSRGIGKSIVTLFAESSANVIIHYNKNKEAAQNVINSIPSGNHCILQANLSSPQEVFTLAEKCINKYKKIDILINNAGIYAEHDIINLSYEEWQKHWTETINTNLTGAANLAFLIAQHMKANSGGKIINISSRGAFRGEPDAPAYGASKAGMNAFGQSFAKAFAPHNILVYTIAPGFVNTEMAAYAMEGPRGDEIKSQSPMNRIADPNEIARTALFLASAGTDYLTGCIVDINGASYLRT